MKTIPEDYKPSDKAYQLIARNDIPIEFAQHQIREFIDYWAVEGTKRKDWDRTFVNRIKQVWEWERHKWQRRGDKGGLKDDLFAIESIGQVKVKVKSVRKLPPPDLSSYEPTPGPAMSPEEAFEQMRKQGLLK